MAENPKADFDDWFSSHINYLPGDTWPEAWLLQKGSESLPVLSEVLNVEQNELEDYIEYALQAGMHQEFQELQTQLGLEREAYLQLFSTSVVKSFAAEFDQLRATVEKSLDDSN